MNTKIVGIFVCMLVIATAVPAVSSMNNNKIIMITDNNNYQLESIDTWSEEQKILAFDGATNDQFGACYLDGDTAIISAWMDDDKGTDSGSVYVFTRIDTTWTLQQKIIASDGGSYDYFGTFVALSSDTALIGAQGDDDKGLNAGAAYIFVRSGTSWTQEAKLLASDGEAGDCFGIHVSIYDDTALVGAWNDDDKGIDAGAAYVFIRSGTTWIQQAKLLASDGADYDNFGISVSLYANTALIGSWYDDDNGLNSGSAYVFTRTGTTWTEQTKLYASDGETGEIFGNWVSLFDDTALVAAGWDDDNGINAGSAYVFTRSGTSWTQQAKLLASDGAAGDQFGCSVSLWGNTALIGVNFDDDKGTDSGSAYIFTRYGTTWVEGTKLLASDGAAGDWFGGYNVCLNGDIALIGADHNDDNGADSGSVYVFVKTTENQPPATPSITGPASIKVKVAIEYDFMSIDPEGDDVYYKIIWGDGTPEQWMGPYSSEEIVTISHTWNKKGNYSIKAKAKDSQNAESDWATLEITVPKDRSINNLFLKFFDRFPHLFPILRHLGWFS